MPDIEGLQISGQQGAVDGRQSLAPMDPELLLDTAADLQGRPVDVTTVYGSVDRGLCQGVGSMAANEGEIRGRLELAHETEEESRVVHVPARVISDLTEVRPPLRALEDLPEA